MNADPADTRPPHLDLEDLIAAVTGQAIDDRAREHLASCEHCRVEANRWDLVADGVCGLAATTPELAQPARPPHTRPHILEGPRRRTMLAASAAAALVLLGGASYGVSAALTGHAPGTARTGTKTARTGTKTAALTAVSGCAGLEQADGTLGQVSGTSLSIKTASGQLVAVTTTASTMVGVSGAPLSDITDGASVIADGPSSDRTIAAENVTVGPPPSGGGELLTPPGTVAVRGTVSDASTAGFSVVTSGGTRVPVTTSSDTVVVIPHASLGQLQAGATTIAVGPLGPDGTLSAIAVLQPQPGLPGHGQVWIKGCSPTSIDDAITTALVSGG
jgi:hypothetical protein